MNQATKLYGLKKNTVLKIYLVMLPNNKDKENLPKGKAKS
jgi:hypothetical protein